MKIVVQGLLENRAYNNTTLASIKRAGHTPPPDAGTATAQKAALNHPSCSTCSPTGPEIPVTGIFIQLQSSPP